ncbi:MAG TPA: prolyl oligopeptidase family serine peptidase [Phycisphaerales bacterium]|nr:prolyl oligopeptidase family serine peptidase [Phycisphaerales bacterium]
MRNLTLATALMTTITTISAFAPAAAAQDNSTYKRPPEAIAKIVEASPAPMVSIDPTHTWMMLMHRESLPPVSDLAAPMLRLAGGRFNPNTNGVHGPRQFIGLSLRRLDADANEQGVMLKLPAAAAGASIGRPAWNLDGTRFTIAVTFADRIELWTGETQAAATDGSVRELLDGKRFNGASGGMARWLADGTSLLVRLVPESRGEMPKEPVVPTGPVVQESSGKKAQVRTYQDLLKNSYDEQLFDWLMATQLAVVDVRTGATRMLGQPGLWAGVDVSPDGKYLLAGQIARPYSYLVPSSQFGRIDLVLDMQTGATVKQLRQVGLRDQIPIEGVETGPRGFMWNDLAPAQLIYAEALDGGDPKNKAEHRDQVFAWDAPFTGEARALLKTQHRYSGMNFIEPNAMGSMLAMVSEYDRDRKWETTWLYELDKLANPPRKMRDLSVNDRYNDPGSPLTRTLPNGRDVARVDEGQLWLTGQGATPAGDRPFLDRESLADFTKTRLWQCAEGEYESVIDVTDDNKHVLTSHQSPEKFPNFFKREVTVVTMGRDSQAPAKPKTGTELHLRDRTPLTNFQDPTPQVREVKKELIKYMRDDGVELSATLYLPPGYDKDRDGPLPLFIWAYPLEYTDKSTAGQVSATPTTFTRMGGISHLCLVFAGYAVMDAATMPVVGDPETVNDTFVTQIVASAKAAIDKAEQLGVGDRNRVAVGGHSYGAFMTANLLAHCGLFKAGVARSGAYNRTLTPFGFQGERRTYWEATDTYTKMSPFTYAGNIKAPLLMIHGQIDNNPGTFPMQSERLFAAIKGLGGTAKLVMLPYESHGYAAMESALHVQAETVEWLDKHVKNVK